MARHKYNVWQGYSLLWIISNFIFIRIEYLSHKIDFQILIVYKKKINDIYKILLTINLSGLIDIFSICYNHKNVFLKYLKSTKSKKNQYIHVRS
jgi:hypothetical protein